MKKTIVLLGFVLIGLLNVVSAASVPMQAAVTVTSPNGGESWEVGSAYSITWTNTGIIGDVTIEYSTDNGARWSTIVESTENDGSYTWTVPDNKSNNCLVQVRGIDWDESPSDVSDAVFSIVPSSSPTIAVTSPNGGERLIVGSIHKITWTSTGDVGNVNIEYSTNNCSSWERIVASWPNNGNYDWTVPASPSDKCLVRVSGTDGKSFDVSNEVFSIVLSSTITITSPNGSEKWKVDSSHQITWTSTGTVGDVEIEYSTNNGAAWTTIVASTDNDGSYTWTVPDNPSDNCLVRITRIDGDEGTSDVSDAVFSIVPSSSPTVTVTSPNGRERLTVGSIHKITWTSTGDVGNVKIEYSIKNGYSWKKIVASLPNKGSYDWTVSGNPSDKCLVRVSETDGEPSDVSNEVFSIVLPPSITVTSPNGGEKWKVGSSHKITWTSTGTVGDVKIEYSTNNGAAWTKIVASTDNYGCYKWTVPDNPSDKCLVRISGIDKDENSSDVSDSVFTIFNPKPPAIALSRTQLNFCALSQGTFTGPQVLWLNNSGGGTLNWSTAPGVSWLNCTPGSGTNAGVLTVSVNPAGLTGGSYTGTITITDPNASNSPQTVTVNLTVKSASQSQPPFGEFATPIHGCGVTGSIPVTGWVLDDVEVKSVKIYNGSSYVGDAVLVEGARPDVEQTYPGHPKNYLAGWGYMMLTHFLPNEGNSTYTLYAKATDSEGHQVILGSSTITCDNANADKPFGAIDTPTQGGTTSGSSFVNWGWVLTPQPDHIPADGSTINVYVDGINLGHPNYNIYRSDIATLFSQCTNSNGAAGYFYLDTTAYQNGVHTIQWTARDSGGNTNGIGSRYFSISNTGTSTSSEQSYQAKARSQTPMLNVSKLLDIPVDYSVPVRVKIGFKEDIEPQVVLADATGLNRIDINEVERVQIYLTDYCDDNSTSESISSNSFAGYLEVNNRLETLPVGSTLDTKRGIFYWQPGPGFIGEYRFVFIEKEQNMDISRKNIIVKIVPRVE